MQLKDVDKTEYLKRSRLVSIVLIICFALTAMISGQALVYTVGNPEGGNFYLNLAGVILGILSTSLLFTVYRSDPRLTDLLYVFRLKRMLARVTNRMHNLKKLSEQNNEQAQIILRFYYEGLLQVYHLDSNEYGHAELEKEQQVFLDKLDDELLNRPLPTMQPEMIEQAAKQSL